MKRVHPYLPVITAAALIGVLGGAAALAAEAAAPGRPAPDFTLQTHDGKTFTLSKLKDQRAVVLVFWASWCVYCMEEVPQVKAFVEANKDKPILVYGVNIKQSQAIVDRFVKEKAVNYRILLDKDGSVSDAYNVTGIPLVIGIDGKGVIRYREHKMPKDSAKFVAMLTQGLEGKPSTGETRAEDKNRPSHLQGLGSRNQLIPNSDQNIK